MILLEMRMFSLPLIYSMQVEESVCNTQYIQYKNRFDDYEEIEMRRIIIFRIFAYCLHETRFNGLFKKEKSV